MKKIIFCVICLNFLFSIAVFAAEKLDLTIPAGTVVKSNPVKTATMHATGKVTEISGLIVKIERTIKGKAEVMEFVLEKSPENIGLNDFVKIDYVEKDKVLTALKVCKIKPRTKEAKTDSPRSVPEKK